MIMRKTILAGLVALTLGMGCGSSNPVGDMFLEKQKVQTRRVHYRERFDTADVLYTSTFEYAFEYLKSRFPGLTLTADVGTRDGKKYFLGSFVEGDISQESENGYEWTTVENPFWENYEGDIKEELDTVTEGRPYQNVRMEDRLSALIGNYKFIDVPDFPNNEEVQQRLKYINEEVAPGYHVSVHLFPLATSGRELMPLGYGNLMGIRQTEDLVKDGEGREIEDTFGIFYNLGQGTLSEGRARAIVQWIATNEGETPKPNPIFQPVLNLD